MDLNNLKINEFVFPEDKNQINFMLKEAYLVINKFSEYLVYLREKFHGDMDCVLIYLIVLLDDLSSASQENVRAESGVSALGISHITGIPRETVRRKIATLVSDGILYRERAYLYHIQKNIDISKTALEALYLIKSISIPIKNGILDL